MENRAKDILAKKLAKKEVPQELDVREMNKTAKELVTTDEGQRKLAQMMRPVFKKKMDYLGFARNLAVVEDCSDGAPLWHEKDYTDIPAVKIGENADAAIIDENVDRVILSEDDEFELISLPLIPLKTVLTRTFKTLDRLKVKTEYGLRITEDVLFLTAIDAATALADGNGTLTSTGGFTKRLLNKAMSLIERHRLKCYAVVCHAKAIADVRSWKYEDTGPVTIQKIIDSGYLGQIYGGLEWYVSDQINEADIYIVTSPEYLAWIPFRTEVEVDPVYLKTKNLIGFKAYLLEAMVVHNPYGVVKITFTPDKDDIYS